VDDSALPDIPATESHVANDAADRLARKIRQGNIAFKAATATANASTAAAEQSRRNQIEKGNQNKPKF
jgi:hypothetical protein